MNRLAPLIVRRAGRHDAPAAYAVHPGHQFKASDGLEDLKLFAMTWLGGLVFFVTFFS